jgi:hypothetical protein
MFCENLFIMLLLFSISFRNYMQLPIAGFVPVEPHRRCCGLRALLSERNRQLIIAACCVPIIYCQYAYS